MARLRRIGAYFSTDLQTTWIDEAGLSHFLALQRLPSSAVAIGVGIELYQAEPASSADDLQVRLELTVESDGTLVASWPIQPHAIGDQRQVTARVALEDVPPGRYVLTAILLEGGRTAGTLSTSFAKPAPPHLSTLRRGGRPAPVRPPAEATESAGAREAGPDEPTRALDEAPEAVLAELAREISNRSRPVDLAALLEPALVRAELAELLDACDDVPPLALRDPATAEVLWAALAEAASQGSGALAAWARGIDALRRRDGREAAIAFDAARRSAPRSSAANRYLGAAFAASGRELEALGAWQQIGSSTAPLQWQIALADVTWRLGALTEVLGMLATAALRFPDAPGIWRRIVELRLVEADVDGARPALQRLLDLAPYDADGRWWAIVLAWVDVLRNPAADGAAKRFVDLGGFYLPADETRARRLRRWLAALRAAG